MNLVEKRLIFTCQAQVAYFLGGASFVVFFPRKLSVEKQNLKMFGTRLTLFLLRDLRQNKRLTPFFFFKKKPVLRFSKKCNLRQKQKKIWRAVKFWGPPQTAGVMWPSLPTCGP